MQLAIKVILLDMGVGSILSSGMNLESVSNSDGVYSKLAASVSKRELLNLI